MNHMPTIRRTREDFYTLLASMTDLPKIVLCVADARKNFGVDFVKELVEFFDLGKLGFEYNMIHHPKAGDKKRQAAMLA